MNNEQKPSHDEDKITIELDDIDSYILAEAIAERVQKLSKESSMTSMGKLVVLQGITRQILEKCMDKISEGMSQDDILLQALKRERELKNGK
jgi:hypothetical protein